MAAKTVQDCEPSINYASQRIPINQPVSHGIGVATPSQGSLKIEVPKFRAEFCRRSQTVPHYGVVNDASFSTSLHLPESAPTSRV